MMGLKGIILGFLRPIVSEYVDWASFQEDNIRIESLSTISLHHISLRVDTISSFIPLFVSIPLQITKIIIEKVTISFFERSLVGEIISSSEAPSWSFASLFSFPCSISIDGIYIAGTLRSSYTYQDRLRLELESFDNYVNGITDHLYNRYLPSNSSSSSTTYTELPISTANELKRTHNPWPESAKGLNRTLLNILQRILTNVSIQIKYIHIELRYNPSTLDYSLNDQRHNTNAIVGLIIQEVSIGHPDQTLNNDPSKSSTKVGVQPCSSFFSSSSFTTPSQTTAQTITSKGIEIHSFGIYCDTYKGNTLPNHDEESIHSFERRMKQEGFESLFIQPTHDRLFTTSSSPPRSTPSSPSSMAPLLSVRKQQRSSRIAAIHSRQTLGQVPFSPIQLISPLPRPVWSTVPTPILSSSSSSSVDDSLSSDRLLTSMTVNHDWILSPIHAIINIQLTDQGRLPPHELCTAVKNSFSSSSWEEEFLSSIPWVWLNEQQHQQQQQQQQQRQTNDINSVSPNQPSYRMQPYDWNLFLNDPIALLCCIWYDHHQTMGPSSTMASNTKITPTLVSSSSFPSSSTTTVSYASRIRDALAHIPFLSSSKTNLSQPESGVYLGGPVVEWAVAIGLVGAIDAVNSINLTRGSSSDNPMNIAPSSVMLRLLRDFEERVITLRPPLLSVTVHIPHLQFNLTNQQYTTVLSIINDFCIRPFNVPVPIEFSIQSNLYRQLLQEITLLPSGTAVPLDTTVTRSTLPPFEEHHYRNEVYGQIYRHTYLHYQQYLPLPGTTLPSVLISSSFDIHLLKQYLFQEYYKSSGRIMELICTRLRTEETILKEKYNDQSFLLLHRMKDYLYPSSLLQRQRTVQLQRTIIEHVTANIGLPVNSSVERTLEEHRTRMVSYDNGSGTYYGNRNYYSESIFRYNGYIWHRLPFIDVQLQVQKITFQLLRIAATENVTVDDESSAGSSFFRSRTYDTTIVPLLAVEVTQVYGNMHISSTDLVAIDKPELEYSQYYQELHDYQTVYKYSRNGTPGSSIGQLPIDIWDQLWILQDKSPCYGMKIGIEVQDIDLFDQITLMNQEKYSLLWRTKKSIHRTESDTHVRSLFQQESNVPSRSIVDDTIITENTYPTGEATNERASVRVHHDNTESIENISSFVSTLPYPYPPLVRLSFVYTDIPVLKFEIEGCIEKIDIIPSINVIAPLANFFTGAVLPEAEVTENTLRNDILTNYGMKNMITFTVPDEPIHSCTEIVPIRESIPVFHIHSSLYVDAPRLIIPLDPSISLTSNIIVDLGCITLESTEKIDTLKNDNENSVVLPMDHLRCKLSTVSISTVIGDPQRIVMYTESTRTIVRFYNEDPYLLAPVTVLIDVHLRHHSMDSINDAGVVSSVIPNGLSNIPWWMKIYVTVPIIRILLTTAKLRHITGLTKLVAMMMMTVTDQPTETNNVSLSGRTTNVRTKVGFPKLYFVQNSIAGILQSLQPARTPFCAASSLPQLSKVDISICVRTMNITLAESSYDLDARDSWRYPLPLVESDSYFDTINCRLLCSLQLQRFILHIDYLSDATVAGEISLGLLQINDLLRERYVKGNPQYPSKLLYLLTMGNIYSETSTVDPAVLRILFHRNGTQIQDAVVPANDSSAVIEHCSYPWGAIDMYLGSVAIVINRDTIQQILRSVTVYQPEEDLLIQKIVSLTKQRSIMYRERMRSELQGIGLTSVASSVTNNTTVADDSTTTGTNVSFPNISSSPFLGTLQIRGLSIVLNTEYDILPHHKGFVPSSSTPSVSVQAQTIVENVALHAEHAMDVAQVAPRMETFLKTEREHTESEYQYRRTKANILSLIEELNYGYGSINSVGIPYMYRGTVALFKMEGIMVSMDLRDHVSGLTVQLKNVLAFGTGYLPFNTRSMYPFQRKLLPLLTITHDQYDRTFHSSVSVDEMIDQCVQGIPFEPFRVDEPMDQPIFPSFCDRTQLPIVSHRSTASIILDTVFTVAPGVPCGIESYASIGYVYTELHVPHILAIGSYFTEGPLNNGLSLLSAANIPCSAPVIAFETNEMSTTVPKVNDSMNDHPYPLPLLYVGVEMIRLSVPLSSTAPICSPCSTLDLSIDNVSLSTIESNGSTENTLLYKFSQIPGYWTKDNDPDSVAWIHRHRGQDAVFLDPSLAFAYVSTVHENISSVSSVHVPSYTGYLVSYSPLSSSPINVSTNGLIRISIGTIETNMIYRYLSTTGTTLPKVSKEIVLYLPSVVWDTYIRSMDQQYGIPSSFSLNQRPYDRIPNQENDGTDIETKLTIEPIYLALTSLHLKMINQYVNYAVKYSIHHSLNIPSDYLVKEVTALRLSPIYLTFARNNRSENFPPSNNGTVPVNNIMVDRMGMSNIGLSNQLSSVIHRRSVLPFEINKCLGTAQLRVKGIQILSLYGNKGVSNVEDLDEIMRTVSYRHNIISPSSLITPLAHLCIWNISINGVLDIFGHGSIDVNMEHVSLDDVRSYINLHPAYRHGLFLSNDESGSKNNHHPFPFTVSAIYSSTFIPSTVVPDVVPEPGTKNSHDGSADSMDDDERLVSCIPLPSAYILVDIQVHHLRLLGGSIIMTLVNWVRNSISPTDLPSTSFVSPIETILMDDFLPSVTIQTIIHRCSEIERAYQRWYNRYGNTDELNDFIVKPFPPPVRPMNTSIPLAMDLSRTLIRSSCTIDRVSIFLVQNPSILTTEFLCLASNLQIWADVDTIGDYKGIINVADLRGARGTVSKNLSHVSYENLRLWPVHISVPPVALKDFIKPVALVASGRIRQTVTVRVPTYDHLNPNNRFLGLSVISIPSLYTVKVSSNQTIGVRVGYADVKVIMDAITYLTVNMEQYLPKAMEGDPNESASYQSIHRKVYEQYSLMDDLCPVPINVNNEDTVSMMDDINVLETENMRSSILSQPLIVDPHKLSLIASLVLPSLLVTLVNDYGNTELPLVVCGINDIRLSALGFHVQDRLICNAGIALYADFFNAVQSIFEPLIEHWSCKWYVLRSEPLSTTMSTPDTFDSTTDDSHTRLRRGIRTDRNHKQEKLRLIDGARLYETEDDITGIHIADTMSDNTPTHNRRSLSMHGAPPPKVQGGRLKRMFGLDQEEKAVQLSTELAYDYHLACLPYVEGIKDHPRINVNSLPADVLVRFEAKKPLQMNFSGVILNSLLDSLDTITKQMYSASGAESLYTGDRQERTTVGITANSQVFASTSSSAPATVDTIPSSSHVAAAVERKSGFNIFIRNACSDTLVSWIEGYQYDRMVDNYHFPDRSNLGESFRQTPTQPLGMLFPTHSSIHENAIGVLRIPECIVSPIRILPAVAAEWTNILCAGTVISYLARKDAWFRSYIIVTNTKQLYWWDTEPILDESQLPPFELRTATDSSLPLWTGTAFRSFSLDSSSTEYRTRITNPLVRTPSEYVFEIHQRTQPSSNVLFPTDGTPNVETLPQDAVESIISLIFCVTTVDDYQVWQYLFHGLELKNLMDNGLVAETHDNDPCNPLSLPDLMLPCSRYLEPYMDLSMLGSANHKLSMGTGTVTDPAKRSTDHQYLHHVVDSTALPPLSHTLDLQLRNSIHSLPYRYHDRTTLPSFVSDSSLAAFAYRRFLAEQRQRRKANELLRCRSPSLSTGDIDSVPLLNISDQSVTSRTRPIIKIAVNSIPEVWKQSITNTAIPSTSVPLGAKAIWDIPVDKIATYLLPWSNPYAIPNPWTLIRPKQHSNSHGTTTETLPTAASHKLGQCLIADVLYEQGIKTLILRSTVVIRNYLTIPLLVQFDDYQDRLIQRLRLSPGQSTYAPLQATSNGKVRFAPMEVTNRGTDHSSYVALPITEDAVRIPLPNGPSMDESTPVSCNGGEATSIGNGLIYLPVIYDNSVPLAALTPYPLSFPPISLIDGAMDEQYHAGRRGIISKVLKGPEIVSTTNYGSTLPISCKTSMLEGSMVKQLPAFHSTAHILRPPADPYRNRGGSLFSKLRKTIPSVYYGSRNTTGPTDEDDDQIYLVPDDDEFGLLTDTNVNITGTSMDGLSSNTVNDRFTTIVNVLPSLMLECLLPFPISYRVHPIRSNPPLLSSGDGENPIYPSVIQSSNVSHGKVRALLPPIAYGRLLPAESQQILFSLPPTYEDTMIPSFGDLVLSIRIDAPGYEMYGWTVIDDLFSSSSFVPLSTEILTPIPSETSTTAATLKRELLMLHTFSKIPPPGSRIYGNDADTELRIGNMTYLRLEPEKTGGEYITTSNALVPGDIDYAALRKVKTLTKTFAPLFIHLERNFVGSAIGLNSSSALEDTLLTKLGQHASSSGMGYLVPPTLDIVNLIQARLRSSSLHLRIFVPYWLINKCDIPLMYRSFKPEQLVLGSRAVAATDLQGTFSSSSLYSSLPTENTLPNVPIELFSFRPNTKNANKMVCVSDPTVRTKWSNMLNVDQIGTHQEVRIPQEWGTVGDDSETSDYDIHSVDRAALINLAAKSIRKLEHQLGYTLLIDVGPGSFSRSRILTFVNRVLIINSSGYNISWRQEQSKYAKDALLPINRLNYPLHGEERRNSNDTNISCITGTRGSSSHCSWMPIHWSDSHGIRKIQLRLDIPFTLPISLDNNLSTVSFPTWNWSIPLAITEGSWSLKLRRYLVGNHNECSYIGTYDKATQSTDNDTNINNNSTIVYKTDGTSPDQSTWLRLSIVTTNGTTIVSVDPHFTFLPVSLQLGSALYRIDNYSSLYGVQIRQQGRGPGMFEVVPCYGTYSILPYPYATDILTTNPVLMLNIVPVGLFGFIHWRSTASNTVGYYLRRHDYSMAASTFVQAAIHGAYPPPRFRQRNNSSWSTWNPTQGNCTINIDEIGSETRVMMNTKQCFGSLISSPEYLPSLVRIRVYADASTGPTKVIHISDAPYGIEETDADTFTGTNVSKVTGEEASLHYKRTRINTQLIEYLVSHIQLLHQSLLVSERLRNEITNYENTLRVHSLSVSKEGIHSLPDDLSSLPTIPVHLEVTTVPSVTLQSVGEPSTHQTSGPIVRRISSILSVPRSIAKSIYRGRENRYSSVNLHSGPALWFQIVAGVNLAISDISGSSDPFCTLHIEVLDDSTGTWNSVFHVSTPVCRATLDPVWNYSHTCYFPTVGEPTSTITEIDRLLHSHVQQGDDLRFHIFVYDYDLHSQNDLLGHCIVPLGRRLVNVSVADHPSNTNAGISISDQWYPLLFSESSDVRPSGSIRIRFFYAVNNLARVYFNFARYYLSNSINEMGTLKERMIKRLVQIIEQSNPGTAPSNERNGRLITHATEGNSSRSFVSRTGQSTHGTEYSNDPNSGIHILQQVDHLRGISLTTTNALRQIFEEYVRLETLPLGEGRDRRVSLPEQELSLPWAPSSMKEEGTGQSSSSLSPSTVAEHRTDTFIQQKDELRKEGELHRPWSRPQISTAGMESFVPLSRQLSGETTTYVAEYSEHVRDPVTILEQERQQRGEPTGLAVTLQNVGDQAKEIIGLDNTTGMPKGRSKNHLTPKVASLSVSSSSGTGTISNNLSLGPQRSRVIGHQLEVEIVEARGLTPTLLRAMKQQLPSVVRSMVKKNSTVAEVNENSSSNKSDHDSNVSAVPLSGRMYAVLRAGSVVRRTLPSAITLSLTFYPQTTLGLVFGPSRNCIAIEEALMRQQKLFTPDHSPSIDGGESVSNLYASVSRPYHRTRSAVSMFTDIPGVNEVTNSSTSSSDEWQSRNSYGSTASFMLRPNDPQSSPLQIIGIQETILRSSLVLPVTFTWESLTNILSSGQYTCLQINDTIALTGQTYNNALRTLEDHIQYAMETPGQPLILQIGLCVVPDMLAAETVNVPVMNQRTVLADSFQPNHVGWNQIVQFDDHVYPPRPRTLQPSVPNLPPSLIESTPSRVPGRIKSGLSIPVHLQYDPMEASFSSTTRITASPQQFKEMMHQTSLPSYLSLSVYARSHDNGDEYSISGGKLIGADSLDTQESLGTEKNTGIIATASRMVGKAVTTAATAGEGMKDVVSAGMHGVGNAIATTARSIRFPGTSAKQDEDDDTGLMDATYLPFSAFLPSPLRAVRGCENLPSGAVSSSDRLLAHREFIPVPSQDEVLDTWISMETVDNPYLYASSTLPASPSVHRNNISHTLFSCLPNCGKHEQEEGKQCTLGIHVPPDSGKDTGKESSASFTDVTNPGVRIRLRWVPLYAARTALRSLRIQALLAGIRISLIDFEPKELLLISIDNLHTEFSLFHSGKATMDTGLQTIRVMNMLHNASRPVIFGPGTIATTSSTGSGTNDGAIEETMDTVAIRNSTVPVQDFATSDPYFVHRSTSSSVESPLLQPTDGIVAHLTLHNHPTVIYIKNAMFRIRHHSVSVDDAIALELIHCMSKLHLVSLFSTTMEETNYAKVLDNAYNRWSKDSAVSTSFPNVRTPTGIQCSSLSTIGPGYTMLVSSSLVSPLPFTVADNGFSNRYNGTVQRSTGIRPIQLIPGEDIISSSSILPSPSSSSPSLSFSLLNYLTSRSRLRNDRLRQQLFALPDLHSLHYSFDIASLQSTQRLYLAALHLYSISLDLSFELTNPALLADVLPNSAFLSILKVTLQSVGTALANIEHAPIQLSGVVLSNLFETPPAVGSRLAGHYIQQLIMQWYRILGSVSFLGNPLGLARGISRDTLDLATQATTILDDPVQVTRLLRMSAVNLAQNTTVGVLDSARQFFSSASKGVKGLHSAGEDYLGGRNGTLSDVSRRGRRNDPRYYQPPATAWEGLQQGTYVFGSSLIHAGEGLVMDPYRSTRYGGLIGLGKGVTSGVFGIVTKPLAGILDGIALTLTGTAASANPNNVIARTRLPRYITPEDGGRLYSLSSREEEGFSRLYLLQARYAYLREETYFYHCSLYGITADITYKHIVSKEVRYDYFHDGMVWWTKENPPGMEEAGESGSSMGNGLTRSSFRTMVTNHPSYVEAVNRMMEWLQLYHIRKEGNNIRSTTEAVSSSTTANVDAYHRFIDTGKKYFFGMKLPHSPFTQQPPLLRSRVTNTADIPYLLLLTDRSIYILHNRTNAIVWYTPITFEGCLKHKYFNSRTLSKLSSMIISEDAGGTRGNGRRNVGIVTEDRSASSAIVPVRLTDQPVVPESFSSSHMNPRISTTELSSLSSSVSLLRYPMVITHHPRPFICSLFSSVTNVGIRLCACTNPYSPYIVEQLIERMIQNPSYNDHQQPRVWLRNIEAQINHFQRQYYHREREVRAIEQGNIIHEVDSARTVYV